MLYVAHPDKGEKEQKAVKSNCKILSLGKQKDDGADTSKSRESWLWLTLVNGKDVDFGFRDSEL